MCNPVPKSIEDVQLSSHWVELELWLVVSKHIDEVRVEVLHQWNVSFFLTALPPFYIIC